ncbi:MAG: NrtA/SsuA/CpmA family ABC transporter substrate-binding protein [Eubacteriales bacterium]|nr:NrtA/SsuA/CpmA family ABC transporter substrate-binding protein [Eubacteriales bacterium]
MKKWKISVMAACLAAGVLAGCGSAQDKGGAQETGAAAETTVEAEKVAEAEKGAEAGEKGTISVTYVKSPLNVPSIVEKDQEIFQSVFGELGYDVAYSDLTTGPEQTQALASGDIQFLNAVGATSVILSASNGADIKIISMYSRSPEAFKLFAADDSIQSPEDLRGKKIAGPKGTILHELLIAYLATADMTEADIEFMAMGIPDSQAALVGGSVDAALLAGPAAYNMEKEGFPVVTSGVGLTDASIVTATSQKFYDEHPELVQAFLDGQKKVLDTMEADYDGAVAATAKETELTEDAVKEMYGMYDFAMEITDKDIEAMKNTELFMENTGMIEEPVDVESLILKME